MSFNINSLLGNNGTGITSLFDTLNKKSSKQSASVGMLDYNMVNSPAYRKALKSYYKQQESVTVTENKTALKDMKSSAADLKASANALNNAKLFEKNDKEEYDLEGIKKAVNDFVKDYNKVVDQAGSSKTTEVLRNGVWMTNAAKKNEALLAKAGITIGKDNKLSFSESSVKASNISNLKTLFVGQSSFGNRMAQKASTFENVAKRALNNSMYNRSGQLSEELTDVISAKLDKDI